MTRRGDYRPRSASRSYVTLNIVLGFNVLLLAAVLVFMLVWVI